MQAFRSGIQVFRSSSRGLLNVASSSESPPISVAAVRGVMISGARVFSQSAAAYSPNSLDRGEVTSRVLDLLRSIPFIDPSKVNVAVDFKKDLQLDMLDNMEVIMAVEDEFAVDVPDNEAKKIATTAHLIDFIAAHPQAK